MKYQTHEHERCDSLKKQLFDLIDENDFLKAQLREAVRLLSRVISADDDYFPTEEIDDFLARHADIVKEING